jgi:hypothetical protein
MNKRKRTKRPTKVNKTLHRKLMTGEHKPYKTLHRKLMTGEHKPYQKLG